MPNCHTLAQSKLRAFKLWLVANGHQWRDGRGNYQVIQVQLAGQLDWHVVYCRETSTQHYSVPWPLVATVLQFVADNKKRKNVNHHPA